MSEIPVRPAPSRLADWINPTGAKKVHALIDKVYKQKNLEMAGGCVKANRGNGGVDGQSREEFEGQLDSQLNRLHQELREDCYQPRPVRQVQVPKVGKPGEFRTLGIPLFMTEDLGAAAFPLCQNCVRTPSIRAAGVAF